jgi:translation initiation factor eIF-2B subunit gamma
MSNKFHDSHVYVCRRTVLDALERKSRLESFREDFFPWLCKLQYQMTRRDKYGRGA